MALKPGEQFTEDIHDKTMQVKMMKPVPGVRNDPLLTRLKRVNFPPSKGYARVEVVCCVRYGEEDQERP